MCASACVFCCSGVAKTIQSKLARSGHTVYLWSSSAASRIQTLQAVNQRSVLLADTCNVCACVVLRFIVLFTIVIAVRRFATMPCNGLSLKRDMCQLRVEHLSFTTCDCCQFKKAILLKRVMSFITSSGTSYFVLDSVPLSVCAFCYTSCSH